MDKLLSLLAEFYGERDRTGWPAHPAFGQFTEEQVGMMQYKHLDHHLRQFNV